MTNKFPYKAMHDRAVILPDPESEKRGNLYLPAALKEIYKRGLVVSIGPGTLHKGPGGTSFFHETIVKEGQYVFYEAPAPGKEFEREGEKYHIVHESSIVLIDEIPKN